MPSSYTNLLYHIVFSTKHRLPLITPPFRKELYPYIGGIVHNHHGILLEVGGISDHIHLVVRLHADMAVADLVRFIKSNASKWVHERPDLTTGFAWQTGYGAFTVSESQLPVVRHYVQTQEEHHRTQNFQEEFVALLRKHGIEYNEKSPRGSRPWLHQIAPPGLKTDDHPLQSFDADVTGSTTRPKSGDPPRNNRSPGVTASPHNSDVRRSICSRRPAK